MFKINFNFNIKNEKIDTSFYEKLEVSDIRDIENMELRYDLFMGDVFLKSDTGEIKLNSGWLPLLDFAYALLHLYIDLINSGECNKQVFEFTDTDGEIYFERIGNSTKISTSYSNEKLDTDINSFRIEIRKFFVEVTDRIKLEFPEIMENEHFVDLLKILDEFDNLNSSITHK